MKGLLLIIHFVFVITLQALAQGLITKEKGKYYLDGSKIYRDELKEIIINSGSDEANSYYSGYANKRLIAIPLILTGITSISLGIVKVSEKATCDLIGFFLPGDCPPTYGGVYIGIGVILSSIGGFLLTSSRSDLEDSLIFYNLQVGINRDGIGLRYNF